MKIPFDYYIICTPSVEPLKLVFKIHWLGCKDGDQWYWGVLPCVSGDWVLAAARICPFVIITLLDTSLFYQVGQRRTGSLSAASLGARPLCVSRRPQAACTVDTAVRHACPRESGKALRRHPGLRSRLAGLCACVFGGLPAGGDDAVRPLPRPLQAGPGRADRLERRRARVLQGAGALVAQVRACGSGPRCLHRKDPVTRRGHSSVARCLTKRTHHMYIYMNMYI